MVKKYGVRTSVRILFQVRHELASRVNVIIDSFHLRQNGAYFLMMIPKGLFGRLRFTRGG